MSKKFLIVMGMVLSLGLTACGSDDGEAAENGEDTQQGQKVYENADFKLVYAEAWEVLEKADFTSVVPSETVVALRSNIKNEIFTTNVNITKTVLGKEMSAADFAASSLSKAKVRLTDYVKVSGAEHEINQGDGKVKAYLSQFQGRKSASDPVVQFKQLYVVKGKEAFIITSAFLATEEESVVKMADGVLNSFALK